VILTKEIAKWNKRNWIRPRPLLQH